jgi:hypothetical protein
MARVKREYDGSLAAWHAATIVAFMPFTGKALSPNSINPYRPRDTEAARKLEEVRRFIGGMAFTVRAREAFEAAAAKGF